MNTELKSFKKVTLLWVMTSILVFIVLILLGIFMRAEQANLMPSYQDYFYPAMTLHGIGMAGVWFVASMGAVVYLATRYIRPSLFAQKFSLICTILGVVLLITATLIGKFAAGWYFLYPLPFKGAWPQWTMHTFFMGITILGVGWLIWSLDYMRAVAQKYSFSQSLGWNYLTGKDEVEVPPFIIITVISVIVCIACLVSAVVLLVLYYVEFFTGAVNDALLMKNLTFFFGHIIVNLSMYLGVAVVYEVLPEYAGREWKSSKPLVYAWSFVLIVVLVAYFHHLYMDFAQPVWLQYAGQIASYTSSIPASVMSIFGALALIYKARMKWNLTSIFFILGLMGWAIGGMGAVIDSTVAVNTKFHNTLWVPAHFHTYMLVGLALIVMGYFYHFVYQASGRVQNAAISRLISVLYIAGGYGVVLMFYIGGANSIPRRYSAYNFDVIAAGSGYAKLAVVFGIVLLSGLLIYTYDLFKNWLTAYKSSSIDD